jgi:hypothetical protein
MIVITVQIFTKYKNFTEIGGSLLSWGREINVQPRKADT